MSVTTEYSVRAEMLTVPAQAACSCEQEMVTGGRCSTGYAAATAVAIVAAITASVASGRYGPCCSKLPPRRTATPAPPPAPSARVGRGESPGLGPPHPGRGGGRARRPRPPPPPPPPKGRAG